MAHIPYSWDLLGRATDSGFMKASVRSLPHTHTESVSLSQWIKHGRVRWRESEAEIRSSCCICKTSTTTNGQVNHEWINSIRSESGAEDWGAISFYYSSHMLCIFPPYRHWVRLGINWIILAFIQDKGLRTGLSYGFTQCTYSIMLTVRRKEKSSLSFSSSDLQTLE